MGTVKGRSLKTLLIDLKNWFALKADTVFSVNGNKPKENGDVLIKEVDLATNLSSDRTQTSDGDFIIRTSGGEAPIQDGDAFALRFLGNMIHTGYVAESLTLTVNAVTRPVPPAITAVLDTSVFEAYVEIAGTYTLIYDGSDWDNDPTDYGITISNTPLEGDTITVEWDGDSESTPVMTVTAVPRVAPPAITATIDRDTFVGYVSVSGTTVLEYDGSDWDYDPANYGVTITNAPLEGDKITIVYVKEDRGLITPATPTSFVSTGWNLYNYDAGYARVCKYRESFRVGGTYTSLSFSPTLSGVQTPIEVVDHMFNVPSDGYVFVTGGNDTDTYIINAWTDWISGVPSGITYEKYSQSVVDISTIMDTYFTNGLYKIGDVYDEINLNTELAISRIGRLAYDLTNPDVVAVIESGRAYDIDSTYIYFVKETESSYSIDIDGYYVVSDHGNEMFLGTSVPVYLETLYGNNLKNKLETDVLTISQQTLTSAQQAQVRQNIGAISESAIINNLTTDTEGYVLDARQGKVLSDQIGTLNDNLSNVSSHLFGKGTYTNQFICPGYISASGNYFSTTLPIATTSDVTTFSIVSATEITIYDGSSKTQYSGVTLSQIYGRKGSITAEFKLPSTHTHANTMCIIFFYSWSFTLS